MPPVRLANDGFIDFHLGRVVVVVVDSSRGVVAVAVTVAAVVVEVWSGPLGVDAWRDVAAARAFGW